jgi:hypothetical protein
MLYKARWNTSQAYDIPFQLHSVTMRHDLFTKEASLVHGGDDEQCAVLMKTIRGSYDRPQVFKDAENSAKELSAKLLPFNLKVCRQNADYMHFDKIKCKILHIEEEFCVARGSWKFDTSLDAMLFINRVAAVFGNDPVPTHLFRIDVQRDVFIRDGRGGRHWVDESEWLASSAARVIQEAMEQRIIVACLALREEGQGIRVTLKPSLDAKSAQTIDGLYGGPFIFSSDVRNKLRMVGQEGWESKSLTITLEYHKRFTVGASWVARVLAPYVKNVEFVTAE